MEKAVGRWNKYNIKSSRPPTGKEGSTLYAAWAKEYGEEKATRLYREFKYQTSHGQKPPLNSKQTNNEAITAY